MTAIIWQFLIPVAILVIIILAKVTMEQVSPGLPHRLHKGFVGIIWVFFVVELLKYFYTFKTVGPGEAMVYIATATMWAIYLRTQFFQVAAKTVYQPFSRMHNSELVVDSNYIELTEGLQGIDLWLYRVEMVQHKTTSVGIPGFNTQNQILKVEKSPVYDTKEDLFEIQFGDIQIGLEYDKDFTHQINNFSTGGKSGEEEIIKIIQSQVFDTLGNKVGEQHISQIDTSDKVKRVLEEDKNFISTINRYIVEQKINVYKVIWFRLGTVFPDKDWKATQKEAGLVKKNNEIKKSKLKGAIGRASELPSDTHKIDTLNAFEGQTQGYHFSGPNADKANLYIEEDGKSKQKK